MEDCEELACELADSTDRRSYVYIHLSFDDEFLSDDYFTRVWGPTILLLFRKISHLASGIFLTAKFTSGVSFAIQTQESEIRLTVKDVDGKQESGHLGKIASARLGPINLIRVFLVGALCADAHKTI